MTNKSIYQSQIDFLNLDSHCRVVWIKLKRNKIRARLIENNKVIDVLYRIKHTRTRHTRANKNKSGYWVGVIKSRQIGVNHDR